MLRPLSPVLAAPKESLESLTEDIPDDVSAAANAGEALSRLSAVFATVPSTTGVAAVVRATPRRKAGTHFAAADEKGHVRWRAVRRVDKGGVEGADIF